MKDIHVDPAGPYYIEDNQFERQVPEVVGELKDLLVLNFSHNSLTSHIRPSLGKLLALESLDLSSNMIEGSILIQLRNLIFLAVLNLSQNNLMGPVPKGNQFDTFTNNSYIGNLRFCGFPLSNECGESEGREPPPSIFDEDDDKGGAFTWKFCNDGIWMWTCVEIEHGIHCIHNRKTSLAREDNPESPTPKSQKANPQT
ncbi:hypothetical protein QQP08_021842 [Theobroma cacao]|nr:hypothetical protein QQP08_020801 [Theobroma cacao]WRX29355.1 hypothetical protein QQP08_021842 [Theobroma cacao]